jgi:all-trans-retinol 13,14-reductase
MGSLLMKSKKRKDHYVGNPFLKDTRRAPESPIGDKELRDSIIKNGYTAKKLEALGDEFDAIIVGSGIGGLVAGAILSRAGKKVLVLEQHDQAGGCCHSFHEKGFEFDTGIHYIGEMRNNTALRFLMDQISDGQLLWADVADDFDTVIIVDTDGNDSNTLKAVRTAVKARNSLPQQRVSFMSDEQSTIASLSSAFPEDSAAILKYFETLRKFRKSMIGYVSLKAMPRWMGSFLVATGLVRFYTDYFKYASKTVTQFLQNITTNPRLRAVFAYNFGDYGTVPGNLTCHCFMDHIF